MTAPVLLDCTRPRHPLPLIPSTIAPADYPTDALGDILGEAAHAIVAMVQCPPELAAQSVLAAASLATQGHADVMHPMGKAVPISLMLVTVAESGERKSTADSLALEGIEDAARGDRLVGEYVGANIVRRYVHGPSVDEPLIWYEGASITDRRWLISDRQGSVIAPTNSSGALVGNVYRYGPYGEPDAWSGSRFSYTGQIMLPELQLYHYKARAYSPTLGRFLQTDPVGYEADLNVYAYVANDPLNASDPSGECGPATPACVTVLGGAVALAARCAANSACRAAALALGRHALREATQMLDSPSVVLDPPMPVVSPSDNAEGDGGATRSRAKDRRAQAQAERDRRRGGPPEDDDEIPGNNRRQNRQYDDATRGLTTEERERLHREISRQGIGRREIEERAREIIRNRRRLPPPPPPPPPPTG